MEFNEVKRQFFAYRNGLLADMLRKQTFDSHRLIFGLNLPQLMEIANQIGTDEALAKALWADVDCRESRLLAPMVCPRNVSGLSWLSDVTTPEEADILCHRLLRHQPGALDAAIKLAKSEEPLKRYSAMRLLLNLMPESAPLATALAKKFVNDPLTKGIANQILNA